MVTVELCNMAWFILGKSIFTNCRTILQIVLWAICKIALQAVKPVVRFLNHAIQYNSPLVCVNIRAGSSTFGNIAKKRCG